LAEEPKETQKVSNTHRPS